MSSNKLVGRCCNINIRILIATIKDMGSCLCPRCLVTKSKSDRVGFMRDMRSRVEGFRVYCSQTVQAARDFMYKSGYAVDGTTVGNLLSSESWVPTIVSISCALFNLAEMWHSECLCAKAWSFWV